MLANWFAFGALAQLVQSEIGDLQHPAGGDHAIRGFEIAVIDQLWTVYVHHALDKQRDKVHFKHVRLKLYNLYLDEVIDERGYKQIVQLDILVLNDIVEAAFGAVISD